MNELNIVKRFISRFEPGINPKIKGIKLNNNEEAENNFKKLMGNKKILQLYHCTESYDYLKRAENIFNKGFWIGPASNKGYGVYFASHAQYSVFWGGRNHVIVCNIIVDEKHVSKHISEIYSSFNNWEYVVSKPELILPIALVEFELELINVPRIKSWSNGMCNNCRHKQEKIEEQYRRCDCKHFPVADPLDIVNYEIL